MSLIEKLWEKRKKGCWISIFLFFLWVLSLFWKFWVFVKNNLYQYKWLHTKKVKAVVISVGNIVVGGTGKTPFVDLLTKSLGEDNVAILSRGYKSLREKDHLCVDPQKYLFSPDVMGDEPYLLAKKNPKTLFFIGKDRVFSATEAVKKQRKLLILDDGFQYRKLFHDLDVVLLSGDSLVGNGYFLPRGPLRESLVCLQRASLLVVNEGRNDLDREMIRSTLRQHSKAPILFVKPEIQGFRDLLGNHVDLDKEKSISLFCAIGNPTRFVYSIKEYGCRIDNTFFRKDHETFSLAELTKFWQGSKKTYLVCTEKDAVKISTNSLPIVYAEMKLVVSEGMALFQEFINGIQKRVFHLE
jgi:tetraacyldisaccharide 4'-kinase